MSKKKKPSYSKNKTVKQNNNVKKGSALRTRDEFLFGGVPKSDYVDKPKQFYRVVYVVDINAENDLAVVRRTTHKGRALKTQPQYKFHEQIYVKDNECKPIKGGKKFVYSPVDNIVNEDVQYIMKRCKHYPDTSEKLKEFKSRNKKKPSKK